MKKFIVEITSTTVADLCWIFQYDTEAERNEAIEVITKSLKNPVSAYIQLKSSDSIFNIIIPKPVLEKSIISWK